MLSMTSLSEHWWLAVGVSSWAGTVGSTPTETLRSEIGKFRWLVEQEVLDEATAEERIASRVGEEAGVSATVFH